MATMTAFSKDTNIFGVLAPKSLSEMNDSEYSDFLGKFNKSQQRQQQLFGSLATSGGTKSNTSSGGSGSSLSSNSSGSSSSGGLFGNLLGGFGDGLSSITGTAKDLANFNLGLYKDQAGFDFGLRDKEADNNFGRQFKLNQQGYDSQRAINTDTQTAMTDRLQRQLGTQLEQQQRDINQQNFATSRAINLASKRLGAR